MSRSGANELSREGSEMVAQQSRHSETYITFPSVERRFALFNDDILTCAKTFSVHTQQTGHTHTLRFYD